MLKIDICLDGQKNHAFRISVAEYQQKIPLENFFRITLILYTKRHDLYSLFNYIFDFAVVFHALIGTENGQVTLHRVLNRGA